MALTPEDIAIIEESLGIEVQKVLNNPNEYNVTSEQADTLAALITDLAPGATNTFIISYNAIQSAAEQKKINLSDLKNPNSYSKSDTKRVFTKKDAEGNIIFEDGEPVTVEVALDEYFPSKNFYDTFYDTLSRLEVQTIQNRAIAAGLISEEDLGDEVNGVRGPVTEGLVITILNYAVEEMDKFSPESLERNAFLDKLQEAKKNLDTRGINIFFNGVNFAENKFSDNQILSRQIFELAFDEYVDLSLSGKKAFDAQRAKEIVAENIMPGTKEILQDLDDLYYSLYGENLSQKRKEDFINDIAPKWSPYVQALVAQDKYIRAGEVYKKQFAKKASVDPVTEKPVTKYVDLGTYELQPEFNVMNPIDAAKRQIQEEAVSDAAFQQAGVTVRDAQKAYMNYIMGGRG